VSTGRTLPLWRAPAPLPEAAWDQPVETDIAIVGAGVAGLSTAVHLARDGRRVHVFDRAGPGQGETLRTTAHLASALDDHYTELAKWHGKARARLAAESHAAAIDWIEQVSAGGCGFRRIPGYLFSRDGNAGFLREEAAAAGEAGLRVAFLDAGIPGLPHLGPALRFEDQARVDMDRYFARLLELAVTLGVRFVPMGVQGIEGGMPCRLQLDDGHAMKAATVVVATNVPFHERVAVHTKQAAYRTYAIACSVDRAALPDALVWDDGDPYHYVRIVDPEPGSDRVTAIIGGEDHKTGQDSDTTAYVRLREWGRQALRCELELTHAWSGQIIEPVDGLAFIGPDPGGERNVYVVTGDSGNGVTHGTLAGFLIADLVAGRPTPWASVYDPRRLARHATEWLSENANVAAQYADWLRPGDGVVAALAAGEGAVVRRGLHRYAVFRCADGRLSAFSARCPHLGCAVRWSATEKSWDCPCHGSRFDSQTGAVLNGPAVTGLSACGFEDDPEPAR
jgi:glycine/D-amino acid oxidase-like deaminating enzyme/nitrite reductase/ring-hydroxylating ferredoxin subunit